MAQVDERYVERLQVGQVASVVADGSPDRRFAERVLSIAPVVDAQRGAIEVKFSLAQQPLEFLRKDMTLSVEVETGRRDAALAVPEVQSLATDLAQRFPYKVEGWQECRSPSTAASSSR